MMRVHVAVHRMGKLRCTQCRAALLYSRRLARFHLVQQALLARRDFANDRVQQLNEALSTPEASTSSPPPPASSSSSEEPPASDAAARKAWREQRSSSGEPSQRAGIQQSLSAKIEQARAAIHCEGSTGAIGS